MGLGNKCCWLGVDKTYRLTALRPEKDICPTKHLERVRDGIVISLTKREMAAISIIPMLNKPNKAYESVAY